MVFWFDDFEIIQVIKVSKYQSIKVFLVQRDTNNKNKMLNFKHEIKHINFMNKFICTLRWRNFDHYKTFFNYKTEYIWFEYSLLNSTGNTNL